MSDEPDLVAGLKKLRYDLTAMQARVSDLLDQAARLNLPTPRPHICPDCGLVFRSAPRLAEHLFQTHAGPLPDHWQAAEARAAEPSS
jgi:hypothetical protein